MKAFIFWIAIAMALSAGQAEVWYDHTGKPVRITEAAKEKQKRPAFVPAWERREAQTDRHQPYRWNPRASYLDRWTSYSRFRTWPQYWGHCYGPPVQPRWRGYYHSFGGWGLEYRGHRSSVIIRR